MDRLAEWAQKRVLDVFDRHERRRQADIPTISVVVGPSGMGAALWLRWQRGLGRSCAVYTAGTVGGEAGAYALARAWVDHVAGVRDLGRDAMAGLLSEARWPQMLRRDEFAAAIERGSRVEREALWDRVLASGANPAAVAVGRAILERSGGDLVAAIASQIAGEMGPVSAVAELVSLVSGGELPGLLVAPARDDGRAVLWLALAAAARLAVAVPGISLAIAVTEVGPVSGLPSGAENRLAAMLREGLIDLYPLFVAGEAAGAASDVAGSLSRLRELGAGEPLMRSFWRAVAAGREARALAPDAEPEQRDRARSAAERFLFEALAELPQTRGLFALNERLDFRFGNALAEIDIVSRQLALAIEIDGYYHFRDAGAYRRDRRKDILLQIHGYWVVRFLAEDVIMALDQVLDRILAVVAARQT